MYTNVSSAFNLSDLSQELVFSHHFPLMGIIKKNIEDNKTKKD